MDKLFTVTVLYVINVVVVIALDLVVVVKAESVHVYCNPLNYPHLLRYIAHWRNLHIHCLTKEEVESLIITLTQILNKLMVYSCIAISWLNKIKFQNNLRSESTCQVHSR